MVQSASSLLKTSGMDASSENLQSFMQILQKNITASMADKGNLFDQSV
jgi:quinol monooxygenase YgiN